MQHDALTLRPARPDDVDRASVLLYSAYIHRQLSYPLDEAEGQHFYARLQSFFRQEGNRFSYQFCQVAEQNAAVIGLVLSFGGRDEERINAAVGWQLAREAQEDEWYVDALAVFIDWGRRGIGARLLEAAEEEGRQHHYAQIALNVACENTQALALYQRLRYKVVQETMLYHSPHLRMVKKL